MTESGFPPPATQPTAMEIALREAEEKKKMAREEEERAFGEDVGAELFSTLREAMVKDTDVETSPLEVAEAENEGTPLEWRQKLRGLISSAKENLGVGGRVEKLKAYFAGRSKELDAEAVGYGARIEKFIRDKGEEYNKLSLKKKMLISAVLGVGAAAFSTVSAPLATAFAINLGIQRFGGMASMYLKFEKHLQETAEGASTGFLGRREWYQRLFKGSSEKEQKIVATLMTATYTAGMSLGITYGVEALSESWLGELTHEWLKSHWPFGESGASATGAGITEATPAPGPAESVVPATAPNTSVAPETPAVTVAETPHVSEALRATQAPEPAVEMPTISASSHGYEGMLKDLMKQLPDKPPANMNPDSDLAKLFEARARPESIGATIHKIAMEHKFFTSEGSVSIGTDAQMTIDDTGNVLFTGEVHVPAHIPATPPEAPVASPVGPPAPPPEAGSPDAAPALAASSEVSPPADQEVVALPPPEAPTTIENPRPIPVVEPPEYKDTLPLGKDTIESAASAPAAEHAHSIVNAFNVEVSTVEPHIYADGANHLYMYGGSPDQQINSISEYLTKNPNSTVFGTSVDGTYRIPWTFVDGKIVPGTPIRTQGILGFFSSWMKAPSPDEFEKFIK